MAIVVKYKGATLSFDKIPTKLEIQAEYNRISNSIKHEEKEFYSLTPAQQQLWVFENLEDKSNAYSIPMLYKINGKLDIDNLKKSLQFMVNRHSVLRSNFIVNEEVPVQVVSNSMNLDTVVVDFTKVDKKELKIERCIKEEVDEGFSLTEGKLIRSKIIKVDKDCNYLLLNIHHIIFDGWSQDIFMKELSQIYDSFVKGEDIELKSIKCWFGDYADYFNDKIKNNLMDEHKKYWGEELKGELPFLEIQPDYSRTGIQKYVGTNKSIELNKESIEKLKEIGKKYGVTLYMSMISILAVFLYRYTGQEDLVIGTPMSCRTSKDINDVIGYFVNMVPIRFKLNKGLSFEELLLEVKKTVLNAYEHQEYPFSKIVEDIKPTRNGNSSPIFQTTFAYQTVSNTSLGELTMEPIEIPYDKVKYDIDFSIIDNCDDKLNIRIDYRTDLYKEETIDSMLVHFKQLVDSVVSNLNDSIDKLSILVEGEYERLIYGVNQSENDMPEEKCVHQLFEKQAEIYKDKIALEFEDKSVTYTELNERANKLANWIRSQGVKKDDPVILIFNKGIDAIVSMLAVMKSGGAYMPVNPSFPSKQISFMIENSGAKVALAEECFSDIIDAAFKGKTLYLDNKNDIDILQSQNNENLNIDIDGDSLVNVLHTSGSTGNPKAVALPHKGIVRLVYQSNFLRFNSEEVVMLTSSLNFDGATMEVWGTLCNGGKLIILKKETVLDINEMALIIKEKKVTSLIVVTQVLNRIIEEHPEVLKGLHQIECGGEAVSKQHIKKALQYCKPGTMFNVYGPTENSYASTFYKIYDVDDNQLSIPIGIPVSNTQVYILDENLMPVPEGIVGDIYVSGTGLARGYFNNEELTEKNFIKNPFSKAPVSRMYKTGDRGRRLYDGNIEFVGRNDRQVKIRGYRIEIKAVENMLREYKLVEDCFVKVFKDDIFGGKMVAYIVPHGDQYKNVEDSNVISMPQEEITKLREYLKNVLPEYMIPKFFIFISKFPLTVNGKIDSKALAEYKEITVSEDFKKPRNEIERKIFSIWEKVLKISKFGILDNFFDLGGHSLLLMRVNELIKKEIGIKLELMDLFKYPTIEQLAEYINSSKLEENDLNNDLIGEEKKKCDISKNDEVAIIGMSMRFPKANKLNEFWKNLREGTECISEISEDELEPFYFNENPELAKNLVKFGGFIDNAFDFDPKFFNMSEHEAMLMDPQQRLLIECVWDAIENAGYNLDEIKDAISLYVGGADSGYMSNLPEDSIVDLFKLQLASSYEFLATNVSYKLNLKGESILLNTACSTSLVAVHLACQSLLSGQSDYALAGGVSLRIPQKTGYVYEPSFIMSPDGKCRAFDKDATGTVEGNGVGVVFLKRLSDAKRDGDPIYAVIKGSAINNDGRDKIGFTAPGYRGQVEVISSAIKSAGISAEDISYIETHGTGTKLGDPLEVSALKEVFEKYTDKKNFCAIGSVKTNIGHLNMAAGIAGLIKTVLALKNNEIPASLNFKTPNPEIDFDNSPFYVNNKLNKWDSEVRIAGVSSFGIGGTNAHVILQEYKTENKINEKEGLDKPSNNVFVLSARSEDELRNSIELLRDYVDNETKLNLNNLAYTYQIGKRKFDYRTSIIASNREELLNKCSEILNEEEVTTKVIDGTNSQKPDVAFLFTGQGSQYTGMGIELYNSSSLVKNIFDESNEILKDEFEHPFLDYIFNEELKDKLNETQVTQPAIFVLEYSLAKLWMSFGVKPKVLIGHSLGEYIAACISGAMSFKEGLLLVTKRGKLITKMCERGEMLSILTDVEKISEYLSKENIKIDISVVNQENQVVVSGRKEDIDRLCNVLKKDEIIFKRLRVSHAFHSYFMDPVISEFKSYLKTIKFNPLNIPLISNLTGEVMENKVLDEEYWCKHLRNTVLFKDGLETLKNMNIPICIEVGATPVLSKMAKRGVMRNNVLLRSLDNNNKDWKVILESMGILWCNGVEINWKAFDSDFKRERVNVPTYPFARKTYNINSKIKHKKQQKVLKNSIDKEKVKDKTLDTKTELMDIIEEITGANKIKLTDKFVDLGGDSIVAIQLNNRLSKRFNIELKISDIFSLTLENLMKKIDKLRGMECKNNIEDVSKVISSKEYPLSATQQQMYFLAEGGADKNVYNLVSAVIIEGKLNIDKYEKALQQVVDNNEQLRATFGIKDSKLVQKINDRLEVKCLRFDYSNYDESNVINDLLNEEVNYNFDLKNGPLFRFKLAKLTEERYIFIMNFHHIIFDALSMNIFISELNEAYNNEVSNNDVKLHIQKNEYVDYVLWQKQRFESDYINEARAFWKEKLSGELHTISLPLDYERPEEMNFAGSSERLELSKELVQRIHEYTEKNKITPYMLFISAYAILLSKYSGDSDVIIGTSVSGRNNYRTENVIGAFINTLALRFKVEERMLVSEFLEEVKNNILTSLTYQDYPFSKLVEDLNPSRDSKDNPIFNAFFSLEHPVEVEEEFCNMKATSIDVPKSSSMFDISLEVGENSNSVSLDMEYNINLFSSKTIRRILNNYVELLKNIVANKSDNILDLELINSEERKYLLSGLNQIIAEDEDEKSLIQLIDEQVIRNPNNIAVSYGKENLSYKELDKKSNEIACKLKSLGVKTETPVAILLERSLIMIPTILGVLKSGGYYVPIDPAYPIDRINYLLENSNMQILITQRKFEEQVSDYKEKCIFIDEEELNNNNIDFKLDNEIALKNLAYIIFTSGSTGKPKGVQVTHGGLKNYLRWASRYYLASQFGSFPVYSSLSFDLTVTSLFIPLINGKRAFVQPAELEGLSMISHLAISDEFTSAKFTPAHLELLLQEAELNGHILKQLRHVIVGGEALSAQLLNRWFKYYPETTIYNEYGPTETVVGCIVKKFTVKDVPLECTNVSIGRPIENTKIYLLDQNKNLVPFGAKGEIYIGGKGVARGYLNREDLTKERFINSPFNHNEILYKTGDLARYLVNGDIEYLGRIDNQVKIRGFRIELGEIEQQLRKYPNIYDCVVIASKNKLGESILIAFVATNFKINREEVSTHLRKFLPDYMIPSRFVTVDNIPLTANGKVDRDKLLYIDRNRLEKNKGLDRNKRILELKQKENKVGNYKDLKEKLVEAWKEVLEVEVISMDDDFFSLGGNSLKILPIVAKIKPEYPNISVQDFFKYRTIETLAEHINGESELNTSDCANKIQKYKNIKTDKAISKEVASKNTKVIEFRNMKNILLTGATGFLGSYILNELFKLEELEIYCLVREKECKSSGERLRECAKYYFGEEYASKVIERVHIINGDLEKESLGIDKEYLNLLSEKIDTIIHCAADVRHFADQEIIEKVNVEGTKQLLDIVRKNKKIHFNYVSTTSIVGYCEDDPKEITIYEKDFYRGQKFEDVYTESKFIAENMVHEAIQEGLDATIYRIGNLVGDSITGKFQMNIETDAFYRVVKSLILLEAAPDERNYVDITPVDYCSKSLVYIARLKQSCGKVYHLCNPNPIRTIELISKLQFMGYRIMVLDEKDFEEFIFSGDLSDKEKEAVSLIITEFEGNNQDVKQVRIDTTEATNILKSGDINCPSISNRLIYSLVNYMISIGYIPKPDKWEILSKSLNKNN